MAITNTSSTADPGESGESGESVSAADLLYRFSFPATGSACRQWNIDCRFSKVNGLKNDEPTNGRNRDKNRLRTTEDNDSPKTQGTIKW